MSGVRFNQLLDRLGFFDRRYASLWKNASNVASKLVKIGNNGINSETIKELSSSGYRPQSIAMSSKGGRIVLHKPIIPEKQKDQHAIRQAAAATVLLRLGETQNIGTWLEDSSDPRMRTYLLSRLGQVRIEAPIVQAWYDQFAQQVNVGRRRSLIQGLGELARSGQIETAQEEAIWGGLVADYQSHMDPGIHSMSEWALNQFKRHERVVLTSPHPYRVGFPGSHWFITRINAHTMVALHPKSNIRVGSPIHEDRRENEEKQVEVEGINSFAMSSKEVTNEQFNVFARMNGLRRREGDGGSPAASNWYEAVAYCNWLSKQEGMPEAAWCYRPNSAGKYEAGMTIKPGFRNLKGYRLPTSFEWEYAARSGAVTSRFYGNDSKFLPQYAW